MTGDELEPNLNNEVTSDELPKKFDAVLGSDYILSADYPVVSTGSLSLGGIAGVKHRLQLDNLDQRIAALNDALQYGEAGIDLVIQALQDDYAQVQTAAYWLLRQNATPRIKWALQTYSSFAFETPIFNEKGREIQRERHRAVCVKEYLTPEITLEMVAVPMGKFLMGSTKQCLEHSVTELPQHEVTVPAFHISKFPVTQAQWEALMHNNPAYFKSPQHPVESISWQEAQEFCQRLTQLTGRKYRLPSEAEWEYACRAGKDTPFNFGMTINTAIANYNGTYTSRLAERGECRYQTTEVGIFPPNAFGLYDMHGNVEEWCQDVWYANYNSTLRNGSARQANQECNSARVVRGGSWLNSARYCRSTSRNFARSTNRGDYIGFRVVCPA